MLSALNQDNSPFSEEQITALQHGLDKISPTQTTWLSGYLAGKLAAGTIPAPGAATRTHAAESTVGLKIFYGSQTGNGEQIARNLAAAAADEGIPSGLQSLADLRPQSLKKIRHAVFVISTHGEGDPPDDALDLFEFLQRPNAPKLDDLKFRVLALGDSTYSQFCKAGRKLEQLLLARGASAFADRLEVDLDYEAPVSQWTSEVLEYGRAELKPGDISRAPNYLSVVPAVSPAASRWHRKNPFPATVQQIQKITGLESRKEVYHLELSLEDSGIHYQPGDSLGVWAYNAPELVIAVLAGLGIDGNVSVDSSGRRLTIAELLRTGKELTRLSPDMVEAYAALTAEQTLLKQLHSLASQQKKHFIEQRQFIDLVTEYPATMSAQELADLLRPLAPRSYSIASSQVLVDEDVHLTVASLRSNVIGEDRLGVASGYLNHHLQPGDHVGVFLEPNTRFRLPQDASAPLILVAAGTGVAPYRAFLQQLEDEGSSRDVWLIFGNPHLRTDFLYQREWLNWRSSGLLTRIDCAFSRDQAKKRYVQHVISDHSAEVNDWLNRGAHVYLCGALAMGQAVESALQESIAHQRGLDPSAAADVISGLRRERRLLKDLY
jgi:sulfite reductase (NADPH) flavoprotein alpha-component